MSKQFKREYSETISAGNERRMFDNKESIQKSLDHKEHIMRYAFASRFMKDKTTLDIACGTGYGSGYLVRHKPQVVIGVDISKEAIVRGKKLYSDELLELLTGDATNMGFKDNVFDVIVSFETLEHLQDYERFLTEVKRILKKNGKFIISTPNKEAFSGYEEFYSNKFHIKEFTLPEFSSLLQRYFEKVNLYGETPMGVTYKKLRDIRRILVERIGVDPICLYRLAGRFVNRFDKTGAIYPLTAVQRDMPKFLVAVCRNKRSEYAISQLTTKPVREKNERK